MDSALYMIGNKYPQVNFFVFPVDELEGYVLVSDSDEEVEEEEEWEKALRLSLLSLVPKH